MSKKEVLKKYIEQRDGYKISETHFKIGSKIHSADFYYAKRLFQNSYYTARIAMLLAINIKNQLSDKKNATTLIGYEMYSELLLSLIKKFLNDFGYNYVNHYTTTDIDGKIKYLPENPTFNDTVIIVVPITSTGSTSNKIKDNVKLWKKDLEDSSVLNYTVIQAFDDSDEFKDFISPNTEDAIITLKTKWSKPSNCKWCFDNVKSKPLFETDKSSLTPTLIFDLPTAKKIISTHEGAEFENVKFKDALIYRRAKRNNEHFLFSTNTDTLIDGNFDAIKLWLQNLKKKLRIKPTDKIVIISPSHYSNSRFINMVNEIVFHNSATIIHHQTDVDYIANFKLLNQTFLSQEDAKIFFVDDSLITGTNFFKIYDLYRYSNDYDKALTGAIFLSNKSSANIHTRVSRTVKYKNDKGKESNNLFAFVNINLPTHPKIFDKKPLEHEILRYSELNKVAMQDAMKKHFITRSKELHGKESIDDLERLEDKKESHYKMFMATHKVYEYFRDNRFADNLTFEELIVGCGFKKNSKKDKIALLKVLSQYPFLLYKPLRKLTFNWLKTWLNEIIKEQLKSLSEGIYLYDQFRELKFLIRRSVFLGNYHVLSTEFLELVKLIFNLITDENKKIRKKKDNKAKYEQADLFKTNNPNEELEYQDLTQSEKDNLGNFHIYLIQNYVEFFHQNGWCAHKVIENLKPLENKFNTAYGRQFIRMLKIEAATILNDFYELLHKEIEWRLLYKVNQDEEVVQKVEVSEIGIEESKPKVGKKTYSIDLENTKIIEFLTKKKQLFSTNKYRLSESLLKLENDEGQPKEQFVSYLWIKQFLKTDFKSNASSILLRDKTEAILQKMKGLFTNNDKGVFFIVNDGQEKSHLVYDRDSNECSFLNELSDVKHELLFQFMQGEEVSYSTKDKTKAKKTIIEFEYDNEAKLWKDLYALKENNESGAFPAPDRTQSLLLIRISDDEFKTLGLIGIYSETTIKQELLAKQLIMLLRKDLAKFIIKHHKNDEFSALREAQAVKRFAYLAGHGRQLMQGLSSEDPDHFKGVVKTMEKLQYLFATKLISSHGNTIKTKENSDYELLAGTFSGGKIDLDILKNIIKIGNQIYKSNKVENEVGLRNEISLQNGLDEDFNFAFNSDILEFLCFELFINAKKNRFHFTGEKTLSNYLHVDFQKDKIKNQLKVSMTGSGAEVPEDVKNKINSGQPLKTDTEIAGLNLVLKVIKLFSDSNRVNISSIASNESADHKIYKNTVTLTLKSIINNE